MCGAHAQIMSAAELSIGIRMANGTRSDIRRSLWVERELVKTFGPRGTVHLLPAARPADVDRRPAAVPPGPDGLPPSAPDAMPRPTSSSTAIGAALGRCRADRR